MKICMISDTHNKHSVLDLEPGDLLIHAGDFTSMGYPIEITDFANWLAKQPFKHKIVVPGNHDILFEKDWSAALRLMRPSGATVLNQRTVEVEGLRIYGEPRQPEFYNWAFNVPRRKMPDVWKLVPHNTDILVTHGPPFKSGDLTVGGEHVGCGYQRFWIEKHQPKLVVCGHIHAGYGMYTIGETTIANVCICTEQYRPLNAPVYLEL